LAARREISHDEYLQLYRHQVPTDGGEHRFAEGTTGRFRLAGIVHHKREYIPC